MRPSASSSTTYYAFDERGNASQRLCSTGVVVSSDLYDGYGARQSTVAVQPDPFGYGGQSGYYTDVETGLCLLTNRYYDPAAGRFVTRDPIGYTGGINLYSYTANNPGNWMDPMGTNRFTDWYMNGMGGTSQFVDKYVMNGSTSNLGQVSGEYDSGCASGLDVAWAGAQFGGNLALNVIPGGGEARVGEVAAVAAEHAAEGGLSKLGNIGRGLVTVDQALTKGSEWLGKGYSEIAPGVYRSAEGSRQFRMTTGDLLDKIPHVHFESIAADGRTILENSHVGLLNH